MAKSRGRKFAEITSPASGVFDLTSVPTITNAKLQNSAMTLAGSSVSLGGTGVADTDALSEGSSNVYFTDARVQTFLGGGTLAGNIVVPDNRSIYVGSSSDFRIIHNTTNTQLTNATGALQITSNGGVDVTGAATFSSTITATGTITGTLATAAQANITSLGTLTGLTVGGNVTINSETLKISGNFPQLFFEDTAGSDLDAYIVNNANGLFFGKTNSPTSSNDVMMLDLTNQRVGIGQSTPLAPLEIKSTDDPLLILHHTEASDNAAIHFKHGGTTNGHIYVNNDRTMYFSTVATNPAMVIKVGGNVGMGTGATANYRLHLEDTIADQDPILYAAATGTPANAFNWIAEFMAPNIAQDKRVTLALGKARSSNNAVTMSYVQRADTNYNALTFGHFGNNDLVSFCYNGNVGIGTTTPSDRLVVQKDSANIEPMLVLKNDNTTADNGVSIDFSGKDTGGNNIIYGRIQNKYTNHTTEKSHLIFYNRNDSGAFTEGLRITHDMRMIVNGGTFSSLPTGSALNVFGNGEGIRLDGSGATSRNIRFRNVSDANPGIIIADGSLKLETEDANTDIRLSAIRDIEYQVTSTNSTAGFHRFKSYGTTIMSIDGGNNRVGIGTASPGYKLQLGDNVDNLGSVTTNKQILISIDAGYSTNNSKQYKAIAFNGTTNGGTDDVFSGTYSSGEQLKNFVMGIFSDYAYFNSSHWAVVQGTGYRLAIRQGGNVGLGLSNPGHKFHSYNTSAENWAFENGTSGSTGKIYLKTTDNSDMSKYLMMSGYWTEIGVHNNEGLRVRGSDGNIKLTLTGAAGNLSVAGSGSDRNFKKDIKDIDTAIDIVKAAKPKTFEFIKHVKRKAAGFIAQDMQEILPDLVSGEEYDEEIESSGLGFDYIGYTAYLTKALQESIARIETLEAEVKALKE